TRVSLVARDVAGRRCGRLFHPDVSGRRARVEAVMDIASMRRDWPPRSDRSRDAVHLCRHPCASDGAARDRSGSGQPRAGQSGAQLMDLQMPTMTGLEAIRAIRSTDTNARIVVLTMHHGDEDIYRALEAG